MGTDYPSHSEMLHENFDELLEDGKKIRAICEDTGIDIREFHALLEVHTVLCYTTDIREFYKQGKDKGIKAAEMLMSSLRSPGSSYMSQDEKDIDELLADNIGRSIAQIEKENGSTRTEEFFIGVLEATKRLYESDEYLDSTIDKYFSHIMPKMGFYTEDVVEYSFEQARRRDSERDKEILSSFGLDGMVNE